MSKNDFLTYQLKELQDIEQVWRESGWQSASREADLIKKRQEWVRKATPDGFSCVLLVLGFRDNSEVHRARPGHCHYQTRLASILVQATVNRDI